MKVKNLKKEGKAKFEKSRVFLRRIRIYNGTGKILFKKGLIKNRVVNEMRRQ